MDADPEQHDVTGPQRATFIVRLWRERGGEATTGWRGMVEYVQGGERRAAADAAGALELLATWLQALER